MVGEVLVERTVAEVAPAVRSNRDQLSLALTKMQEQLERKKKALADFQEQYKVRVKGEGTAEPAPGQAGPASSRGVMV
ncbi:hypothetical protein WJX81_003727 [Elliptochloris bilobata]|uniref:Prefoldin subunit 6 n=1 Tax=Elliptochloris bilobata TaxID=381761 RepID=A0AAW1QUM7_9CHLO